MRFNIGAAPLAVLGAAMTAVSGACWGYVYASKELEDKFNKDLEKLLDKEIDKVQRYYATLYKDTQPEDHSELDLEDVVVDEQHISIPKELLNTPEGRAAVMAEISKAIEPEHEDLSQQHPDEEDVEHDPIVVNAFDEQELLDERSGDKPYIISKEEFLRNDAQFETYTLTFFEGDGVLIDEQDDAIPDTDFVVGDQNLRRFGVLSGNNNVVYVQNDQTEALFEIHRSFQTASEAMFGPMADEDVTLEHSNMRRRRHRREDG